MYQARSIVLCPGVAHGHSLAGESAFLGRGVSYCATCDGYLYKGKTIRGDHQPAVCLGKRWNSWQAWRKKVKVWSSCPVPDAHPENIQPMEGQPQEVLGDGTVTGLQTTAGKELLDGLFILRETDPLEKLLPGLELNGSFIRVDEKLGTSVPGVFAAGDAAGYPWQINKAAGKARKRCFPRLPGCRRNGHEEAQCCRAPGFLPVPAA